MGREDLVSPPDRGNDVDSQLALAEAGAGRLSLQPRSAGWLGFGHVGCGFFLFFFWGGVVVCCVVMFACISIVVIITTSIIMLFIFFPLFFFRKSSAHLMLFSCLSGKPKTPDVFVVFLIFRKGLKHLMCFSCWLSQSCCVVWKKINTPDVFCFV